MNIAGIDYSMSCPAITIGPNKDFDKCHTFFYSPKKKHKLKYTHNIYGFHTLPYDSQIERFENIANWAITILKKFKVSNVCLEGYSMGSKGQVFNIGENTGILKLMLYKNGIDFVVPAPTQVKKYFTDKGNANKSLMYDAFVEKTKLELTEVLSCKKEDSPISDIVDSYAMLCFGFDECTFK